MSIIIRRRGYPLVVAAALILLIICTYYLIISYGFFTRSSFKTNLSTCCTPNTNWKLSLLLLSRMLNFCSLYCCKFIAIALGMLFLLECAVSFPSLTKLILYLVKVSEKMVSYSQMVKWSVRRLHHNHRHWPRLVNQTIWSMICWSDVYPCFILPVSNCDWEHHWISISAASRASNNSNRVSMRSTNLYKNVL